MSAAALMEWLGEHMPKVRDHVRAFASSSAFAEYMDELACLPWRTYDSHDLRCAAYLEALKRIYPTPEPKPQRSGPEVPPEVWNTRPVDADLAMAAVRAICGQVTATWSKS